jgi:hypothetical protein
LQFESHLQALPDGGQTYEDDLVDQQDLAWQGGDTMNAGANPHFFIQTHIGDLLELSFTQFQATVYSEYRQAGHYYSEVANSTIYYLFGVTSPSPPLALAGGQGRGTDIPGGPAGALAGRDALFALLGPAPQSQQTFSPPALHKQLAIPVGRTSNQPDFITLPPLPYSARGNAEDGHQQVRHQPQADEPFAAAAIELSQPIQPAFPAAV